MVEKLSQFRTGEINLSGIAPILQPDTEVIQILNRESTKAGSPINKSFNLSFGNISKAVLKVNLLADQGKILGIIPNEFRLNSITVNGKRFVPSNPRNSSNIIHNANDGKLNNVLNLHGNNEISVDFSAPIGAGVTSPHAEVSGTLEIHGTKDVLSLSNLPNFKELSKGLGQFVRDNTITFVVVMIILAVILYFITRGLGSVATITKAVK